MTVLLGLLAAVAAGTSDFLGGLGSRRAPALVVTTSSHVVATTVALVAALLAGGSLVATDFYWSALAGLGGATGLLSIYSGYAVARVSIVAPLAGVGAAALPVLAETAIGEDDLSSASLAGVALGLVAIGLVSVGRSDSRGTVRASLLHGAGGAIGLGLLLLCLARTSEDAGIFPVAFARGAGSVVLVGVSLTAGAALIPPRSVLPHVLGIAMLASSANAMFLVAARVGSTSVAAVLTSLFPAVTVVWAWSVFGERLRPIQVLGLIAALVSVGLIVAG